MNDGTREPLLRLHYPLLPLSANERQRTHWAKLKKEKDDFTLITPACHNRPTDKRRIEVTFFVYRQNDRDNLFNRAKVIFDALRDRGWIVDDSPTWCEQEVVQTTVGKDDTGVFVEVFECVEKAEAA